MRHQLITCSIYKDKSASKLLSTSSRGSREWDVEKGFLKWVNGDIQNLIWNPPNFGDPGDGNLSPNPRNTEVREGLLTPFCGCLWVAFAYGKWACSLSTMGHSVYECLPWTSHWLWKKESAPGAISDPWQGDSLKGVKRLPTVSIWPWTGHTVTSQRRTIVYIMKPASGRAHKCIPKRRCWQLLTWYQRAVT